MVGECQLVCLPTRIHTPIAYNSSGEMWDLEELSLECAKQKRFSFFLTSMPLHITGGVAGPANVLAIF